MKRVQYNQKIVNKLQKLIIKYPDWRFGQILFNCEFIKHIVSDGGPLIVDPFYEESEITWNRIKNYE